MRTLALTIGSLMMVPAAALAQQAQPAPGAAATATGSATATAPTVGATIYDSAGVALGTIKAADAQFVTLTTAKGDVKLPIAGFSADASGKIVAGITADQLAAATTGAAK